jgi:hypothetical protein
VSSNQTPKPVGFDAAWLGRLNVTEINVKKHMIGSKALRMTFLVTGLVIWLGIWLTGFSAAHWVLYIPAIALVFAGTTGICPGLITSKMLLKES